MKYYSYENFKNDTRVLLKNLEGLRYDAILGISRGGLTLTHALSQGLRVRDVYTLRSKLYEDNTKLASVVIEENLSFNDSVKKVLIVDDIADSGETLAAITTYLNNNFKNIEFEVCTLFYKKTSIYEPTYWVRETNEWIDFFWEADFRT